MKKAPLYEGSRELDRHKGRCMWLGELVNAKEIIRDLFLEVDDHESPPPGAELSLHAASYALDALYDLMAAQWGIVD